GSTALPACACRLGGRGVDEGPFVVMRAAFVQADGLVGALAGHADDAAGHSGLAGSGRAGGTSRGLLASSLLSRSLLTRLITTLPVLLRLGERHEVAIRDRVF